MKKILFVIQSLRLGGAERAQVTLANKLVEIGYDVTVLIWMPKYDLRDELDERVHLIYKAPDEHLGNKIPYIRYKFYDDVMWQLRAAPQSIYRYYVGRKDYDVEIAFFHSLAVEIVGGSTNRNAVHIAWIHHDLEKNTTAMPDNWTKHSELYRSFDRIVCVSNSARESFLKTVGDTGNVHTIYNLIPIQKIRKKAEEKPQIQTKKSKFHIVMVCRFVLLKGYDRLIRSVAKLRNEGKDISLTLVGAEDPTPVTDLISECSAEDYITIAEPTTNPYPYIAESSLLVCASYTEGYNLTVAEALVLGVPVLSTDCAGPNEILDHGKYGMIVENSEEGIYEGLKKLYDSPELLNEYKEKAAQRMDFFDEDKIIKQITDLF